MAKVKAKAKANAKPRARAKPAAASTRKAAARSKPATKQVANKRAKTEPAAKQVAHKRAKTEPAAKQVAQKRAKTEPGAGPAIVGPYLRSLRTCIYQVYDLALAREFYSQALGKDPYFDEPYYVGFDVDGHELGLDPDVSKRPPGGSGVIGYWRVEDINAAWQHLTTIGATSIELPHSVGVDLQVSIVSDPFGNYIGLIQGA